MCEQISQIRNIELKEDIGKLQEDNYLEYLNLVTQVRLNIYKMIVVSRIQINDQLAIMSIDKNNKMAEENIQLLKCAINEMLEQEKEQKSIVMGAK